MCQIVCESYRTWYDTDTHGDTYEMKTGITIYCNCHAKMSYPKLYTLIIQ